MARKVKGSDETNWIPGMPSGLKNANYRRGALIQMDGKTFKVTGVWHKYRNQMLAVKRRFTQVFS